jgi:hypothetical protein
MILGGFAAPLFLFLAGFAVPLAAQASLRKTGSRRSAAAAAISRGLIVFILAFAFRLQAFIVSPGNSALSLFRVDILNIMGPALALSAAVWAVWHGAVSLHNRHGVWRDGGCDVDALGAFGRLGGRPAHLGPVVHAPVRRIYDVYAVPLGRLRIRRRRPGSRPR